MKIEDKRGLKNTSFSKLERGSLFSCAGAYYIKCDDHSGEYAVNISTGKHMNFSSNAAVEFIHGTLVIED